MHRMHEAHGQQHQLGLELEFAAGDRLELVVDAHAMQFLHRCRFRRKTASCCTANSRSAPSSWLDEVRSFSGQSGQVSALFSCSGGFGMISNLVTEQRALAERGADAVRAGIAAADHDHVLALGEDRLAVLRPSRRLTRRFCCGRKSIAKWMPLSSRPGTGRSRGFSAPPVSTTAS